MGPYLFTYIAIGALMVIFGSQKPIEIAKQVGPILRIPPTINALLLLAAMAVVALTWPIPVVRRLVYLAKGKAR